VGFSWWVLAARPWSKSCLCCFPCERDLESCTNLWLTGSPGVMSASASCSLYKITEEDVWAAHRRMVDIQKFSSNKNNKKKQKNTKQTNKQTNIFLFVFLCFFFQRKREISCMWCMVGGEEGGKCFFVHVS